MNPKEIKKLREKILGLTQVELASLLGVHPITISKWECGKAKPNSYQFCLLVHFAKGKRNSEAIYLPFFLCDYGFGATLALLLNHLLPTEFPDEKRS